MTWCVFQFSYSLRLHSHHVNKQTNESNVYDMWSQRCQFWATSNTLYSLISLSCISYLPLATTARKKSITSSLLYSSCTNVYVAIVGTFSYFRSRGPSGSHKFTPFETVTSFYRPHPLSTSTDLAWNQELQQSLWNDATMLRNLWCNFPVRGLRILVSSLARLYVVEPTAKTMGLSVCLPCEFWRGHTVGMEQRT